MKKDLLIKIIIFILFAILTFFVGIHHEPWADEAQSWLIGRDCSFLDIIFKVAKYEGSPALWFVILKCLNYIHFPYKYLFIIPWMLGNIGVYLLIFKSKLNNIIKFLFPFTFYMFYQYSVIARTHALFFPFLALIATLYPNRLRHPYIYAGLLMLLASISAYGFVLAFVLLICFGIDIYKQDNKLQIKKIIPAISVGLFMLGTAIILKTPADCTFSASLDITRANPARIIYIMTRGYFNTPKFSLILILQCLVTILLYIFAGLTFCKNIKQSIFFISTNLAIAGLLTVLYCNYWHSGYLICTLMFSCWILSTENCIDKTVCIKHKIFYVILTFIFLIQILWSYNSAIFDIKHNYSGSKQIAEFIKENNLTKYKIQGLGFHTVAIQPYFEKNIFDNFSESYWRWDKKSQDNYISHNKENTPVIIIDDFEAKLHTEKLKLIKKHYKEYHFDGTLYVKGQAKETSAFTIYILENNKGINR